MKRLFAILVLAVCACFALPADPVAEQNPVPANSFAVVSLKLEKGDKAIFEVTPEPTKLKDVSTAADAIIHFNGPPGAYTVNVFLVNFDSKTFTKKKVVVTIGQGPQPPPDPPTPPNPPVPTGIVSRFVVVEDTSKSGSWRGDVLGSPKIESMYRALRGQRQGAIHRLIDINADGDDPAATYFKKAAVGKTLPYLWLLDDSGKTVKELPCPTEPDKFIAAFDTQPPRALGALPGKPKLKWNKVGDPGGKVPIIPRTQWKPVDLGVFLPPVHDQDGIGQCASSAACTIWEACRAQAGLPYVYASAGDLYSRVNGGSDNGSLLEDNMVEMQVNGVAPASMIPYVWDRRTHNDAATKAARSPNKIVEIYQCDDFDACASAIQHGFFVEIGTWWYDNFTPDSEGWLPKQGRGGRGGHALTAYGLTKRADGTWGLKLRNSWSASWGIGGNCVIPENWLEGTFSGYWACRAVQQTKTNFPFPQARHRFLERGELVLKP